MTEQQGLPVDIAPGAIVYSRADHSHYLYNGKEWEPIVLTYCDPTNDYHTSPHKRCILR